jgi:hypothetical protein
MHMIDKPAVTKMHSTDYPWVTDESLVRYLTAVPHRPNLMVHCREARSESVVEALQPLCTAPVFALKVPGPLRVPLARAGTLLIEDAAALTLTQQIALHDWLNIGRGDLQIITVTSRPLWPMVQEGKFLEGLFYRLNVVYLES